MSEAVPAAIPEASSPAGLTVGWVAFWTLTWLSGFAVFHYLLIPNGFGMYGTSWPSGIWYVLATLGGAWLMRTELRFEVPARDLGPLPVVVLGLSLLVALGVALWVARAFPLSEIPLAEFEERQIGLILLNLDYYLVKLPELCFQQTLMFALVRRLQRAGRDGWNLVGSFALLFGGIHLPLIAIKGLAGLPFILAATGAAALFAPLIAFLRRGVLLSFCVHLLAYSAVGAYFRATYTG